MITLQQRRDEALKAGFIALQDRISMPFDAFAKALADWDVKAFCKGEDVVGMLMVKDNELHVAVLPEVRGRWLSRTLIREVIGPLVRQYGKAKTKVAQDNQKGQDFCARIGFAKTEHDDIELLREGFERKFFDPTTALIGIGGSLLSGAIQGGASKSAADTAANASNAATNAQLQMFNTINQQQQPWRTAGEGALGTIGQLQPQFTHQFGAEDLKSNLAPNYEFQLGQGLGAVKNAANMQTGLVSGNAMKGVNDYAQNFAGNAYQNAFQNYQNQQSNIFNRLSAIAGLGQQASATSANAGASISPGIANSMIGAGQAQAAGTVGLGNALVGGANNALGWYALPQILNQGNTLSGGGYNANMQSFNSQAALDNPYGTG